MFTALTDFPQLRIAPRIPRGLRGVAGVAVAVFGSLAAACDRTPQVATTDSSLSRDLTLATASTAPSYTPGLSDTAIVKPTNLPTAQSTTNGSSASRPDRSLSGSAKTAPPKATPKSAPVRNPVTTPPAAVAPEPTPASIASGGSDSLSSAAASGTSPRTGSGTGRRALGSGTRLISHTNAEICSLANRPGDRLVATLEADVVSPDGSRLVAGTPVLVEMSAPAADGTFAFRVKAVQVNGVLVPVEGTVAVAGETTERQVSKGGDKGKVVGGAIAGAILGRVLGGGTKGTIIGAAGGAAAGTAAAARNTVTEKCLPAGATVTVTLTAPLVLAEGVP